MEKNYKSIFAADMTLLLVAFIWGTGIPLSALLARTVSPLWAIALRMILSAFFLSILFPKTIIKSTALDCKISFILTALLVIIFICMTFGLIYSTASKQSFIGSLNVIFSPLLVWAIYKVRPSNLLFTGASVTTIGLMIMGFSPEMRFCLGDILSFIMAFTYSIQIISAEYCSRRVDPVRLTALHIIMLAVILTIIAYIFEPFPDIASFDWKIWGALIAVSLFNTVVCFILQFRAQRVTSATHVSIICSLEGLFGYITTVLSGQDPFHLQGAIGGLMMIAGVIITESEGLFKKGKE